MKRLDSAWARVAGLLIAACCLLPAALQGQEVSHALTLGVGHANVYDSYLSPLEYSGTEIRLQREAFRQTKLMEGRVYVQTLLNAHASYSKNPGQNGKMYEGLLNWNIGWLYRWPLNDKGLEVMAGPMADLNGGAIYNKRNSNNPAQAKVYANADISGLVSYRIRLFNRDFRLRYQVALPLVGVMFSPEYGESYYEMFRLKQGGWHNICLTTPFNQPALRQSLYVDFTLYNTNLRVGYVADMQQSKVNHLRSHTYGHALMVGVVKHFQLIKKTAL